MSLVKGRKDPSDIVLSNANASVADSKFNPHRHGWRGGIGVGWVGIGGIGVGLSEAGFEPHASVVGEFYGITEQVVQDLSEPHGIASEAVGQVVGDGEFEDQSFLGSERAVSQRGIAQ
jgi:hypothetical protein